MERPRYGAQRPDLRASMFTSVGAALLYNLHAYIISESKILIRSTDMEIMAQ
jgi:hypothetical protein